ncbi:MAG: hypothetical protein ACRCZI_04380 [Cetobacterium sp.]
MTTAQAIEHLKSKDPSMPVFVILGSDPLAAATILQWCLYAYDNGVSSEKSLQARLQADVCSEYQPKKLPD